MRATTHREQRPGCSRARANGEGSVVVITMVFIGVFLVLGLALYWLIASQTRSTEMERTDVKAFNVAEAGVDAGMLCLKMNWPDNVDEPAIVNNDLLKTKIKEGTQGLWDPSNSDPSEFIQVIIYDNVDSGTGQTTTTPDPNAPQWDSNDDGLMFVDSTANVDDDRHRILIMAERQDWPIQFGGYALVANTVDSNGQGLEVGIEDGAPPIWCDVQSSLHKGVDLVDGVTASPNSTTFADVVTAALKQALLNIAKAQGTYFDGADAATRASAYLKSGAANGGVVYVKSDTAVTIAGDSQIGTVDDPVVVVLDTPDTSVNEWDMKGSADFYGIVLSLGATTLRGTCGVHGALYCGGTLTNKGNGNCGEINFNQMVIWNINHQYVISVNIVPNSWEEYTLPGA